VHTVSARRPALAVWLAMAMTPQQGCDATERRIDLLPPATTPLNCSGDGDCAVPTPYCFTESHECVECLTTTNCGNKVCASATHVCQECESSGDCAGPKPYCLDGACVACTAPGNCPEDTQTCDPIDHRCVPRCASDTDCTDVKRPHCWAEQLVCVECLGDEDCDPARPRCVHYQCRKCASDGDCAAPRPYCLPSNHECKACLDDSDCDAGLRCDKNDCKP